MAQEFHVVDMLNDARIVATFPTFRRATNHTRKLEPVPAGEPIPLSYWGNKRDWRYLISTPGSRKQSNL